MLEGADALVMPTVPMEPSAFGDGMDRERMVRTGPGVAETVNTGPFDLSHPLAIAVPSGTVADVPVGTTSVDERFDEGNRFALGAALEGTVET